MEFSVLSFVCLCFGISGDDLLHKYVTFLEKLDTSIALKCRLKIVSFKVIFLLTPLATKVVDGLGFSYTSLQLCVCPSSVHSVTAGVV